MYTAAFRYLRPKTLAEAEAQFRDAGDAKYLAGGQTLIPTMKQRLAAPSALIDIARIPGLAFIRREANALVIGAATPHADVAASPVVRAAIPALAHLAGLIGDPAVRHKGTIGGSLANNDPAADYPAAVLGLNATIATNKRDIAADRFFTGLYATALKPGEIITQVAFPLAKRAAYVKFHNPASRFALVGVFVAQSAAGVRVAVTGAASCVFRVKRMEKALAENFTPDAVARIKVAADKLNSDIHAAADYRAHLITVLAQRAVAAALAGS